MSSRHERRHDRHQRRHERLTKAADKVVKGFGPRISVTEVVGDLNFEPDGPVCTSAQKAYVYQAVSAAIEQGVLGGEPELTEELTIGQAEGILFALGASPDALHKGGRAFGAGKEQRAWRANRARR